VLLGARPAEAGDNRDLLAALTTGPRRRVGHPAAAHHRRSRQALGHGLGHRAGRRLSRPCVGRRRAARHFLLHTLVEALREERISPVAASAGRVQSLATASLGRWALLRLGQLGPDATRLARAVAVLGRADPRSCWPAGRAGTRRRREGGPAPGQGPGVLVQPPARLRPPSFCAPVSTTKIEVTERADTQRAGSQAAGRRPRGRCPGRRAPAGGHADGRRLGGSSS